MKSLCSWSALLLFTATLLAWMPAPADAQTITRDLDLVSLYQTDLRALAMGNAYGAVARGEGALLHNPAGLVQFDLDVKIDFGLAVEGEEGDFFSDTFDALNDTQDTTTLTNYFTKYLGTTNLYRAQVFSNFIANLASFSVGFGVGVMQQERFSFEFRDTVANGSFDAGDELVLGKQSLDINFGAFAFKAMDGQLLVGFTFKSFTYKEEVAQDTFGNILGTGNVDLATAGPSYEGNGYDIGMIWRMEFLSFLRGQWSLTAFNVGGITLTATGADTLEIPATLNIGFSINPEFPLVHLLLSAEMEDVTGAISVYDPIDMLEHKRGSKQRAHFGAELGIFQTTTGNNILNGRVGAHRGFISYGFELNLFSALRVLYTVYKDNLGHEDRQDLHKFETIQLSLGFGF